MGICNYEKSPKLIYEKKIPQSIEKLIKQRKLAYSVQFVIITNHKIDIKQDIGQTQTFQETNKEKCILQGSKDES